MRKLVIALALLAACRNSQAPDPDRTAPGGPGSAQMSVKVPQKHGADANDNGVLDMPATESYARGPVLATLNAQRLVSTYPSVYPYASDAAAAFGAHAGPWRWTLTERTAGSVPQGIASLLVPTSAVPGLANSNDGTRVVIYTASPLMQLPLYEGEWTIEIASVSAAGTPVYWKSRNFQINDVLIVQVGDSYSAGEGAPDRSAADGYWGDDGTTSAGNGAHRAPHRSSYTWGSVFAKQAYAIVAIVGSGNPELASTVTYLNAAVSGAVIAEVDDQLDAVTDLTGTRKIDILLVSIGGNDAGFGNAITAYLVREPIFDNLGLLGPTQDEIRDAIRDGDWTGDEFTDIGSVLVEMFDGALPTDIENRRGLNGMAAGYQELAGYFTSHGIDASAVRILKYPDPLVSQPANPGAVCPDDILTAVSSVIPRQLEIDRGEQQHARAELILPLNVKVVAAAALHGWQVVDAEEVMHGHAICESDRMVLRYQESQSVQGDRSGTLHPNRAGYEAIASKVW